MTAEIHTAIEQGIDPERSDFVASALVDSGAPIEPAEMLTDHTFSPVARALVNSGALFLLPTEPPATHPSDPLGSEPLFSVPTGFVRFASGILSPVYMDIRRLLAHPAHWSAVIKHLLDTILSLSPEPEVIAGVAVGGVPHSTAVALQAELPSSFVRNGAKAHGRTRAIEGAEVKERHVVLIEDVITTGGSSLEAVEILQEAGGEVVACVAVTGYGFSEATERFGAAGVPLRLLTTFERVLEAAESNGANSAAVEEARRWHSDPRNWSP